MKMKKFYVFISPLLFQSIISLSGQGIYRPGYIVDNDLDTLRGLVYDGGDMANSSECKYKVTENGKVSKYSPGEIESYHLDNYRFYKSMKLPLDKDSVDVFAEFPVDGLADIFYFRNINGNHYYVRNEKQEIIGWMAGAGFLMQLGNEDRAGLNFNYAWKADRTYVNSFTTINGINIGAFYYF